MRPFNLIPSEQRAGRRPSTRTGMLVYVVVGGLAAVLAALTLVVVTGNKVADQREELRALQAEQAELASQVTQLAPYAAFSELSASRTTTVASLARSRFDWARVLRELALVLPEDVWLTSLTATVAPDVQVPQGTGVSLRGEAEGPALEIIGCGIGHQAVARFLTRLEDIGGVTRVAASRSQRPTGEGAGKGSGEGGDECRTRDSVARFELVAAFDGVEAGPASLAPVSAPAGQQEGEKS